MLGLVSAIALLALLVGAQNKGTLTADAAPTTASLQGELTLLQKTSPEAYAAVNTILNTDANPALIAQYALNLNAQYPNLAKFLIARFNKVVVPFVGKSGTTWNTWSPAVQRGATAIDVSVLLQAMPVLLFHMEASPAGIESPTWGVRTLTTVANGVDSATVARARADFTV